MSDISTKLQYLNTTKGKIKNVINMTGANITSDTTFRNYATKLYDGYISVLKDKNTLLDNMPKGTSTGTITDAADLPVYEDKMSKESTQDGTPTPDNPVEVKTVEGYRNLFDKENVNWYRNNDSTFDNKTNNSTTRIRTSSFEIQGGKTYIISGYPSSISLISVRAYDSDKNYSANLILMNNNVITLAEEAKYIHLLFGGTNFTDETNELMKNANIQIVEGTEELPYIPYGTNWVYKKIVGKNLLEITENARLTRCTYVSGANTNEYKLLCTASDMYVNEIRTVGNSYDNYICGNLINLEYGETIYYDVGNSLFTGNYFTEFDENLVSLGNHNKATSSGTYTPTNANCKYVSFRFGYGRNAVAGTTYTLSPIVCKVNDTSYEPYKENIIALPLRDNEVVGKDTTKDEYIIDKNGHCWLNKKIGKVVLDGINNSFTSVGSTNTTGVHRFMTADIGSKLSTSSTEIIPAFCNRLISKSLDDTYVKQEGFSFLNSTHRISIYIDEISTYTLEQANEWLLTHNLELYYPLAQEDLIDLNYNVDIRLFNGINNISNSDDMDMEIKYIKDTYE